MAELEFTPKSYIPTDWDIQYSIALSLKRLADELCVSDKKEGIHNTIYYGFEGLRQHG